MTDDEIIRLAREAGDDWDHTLPTDREFLLRFAALVAAAELRRLHLVEQALERCKAVCDATSEGWRADAEQWQTQRDELLDALKDTTAHLVAATTLLVRGGEQAVASDQMFSQMLADYTKSFKRGMAVIWAAMEKNT